MSKLVKVTFSDDQQACIMLPENIKSHAETHEWLHDHLIGVVDWDDAYIEVTEGLDLGRGKTYTLNVKLQSLLPPSCQIWSQTRKNVAHRPKMGSAQFFAKIFLGTKSTFSIFGLAGPYILYMLQSPKIKM